MKRKLIAFILVLSILSSFGCALATTAELFARDNIPISPKYDDIGSITIRFSAPGATATYNVIVSVNADVTEIDVSFQLQKKNSNGTYSNYGTAWADNADTFPYRVSGSKPVASGGTYRLKVTVTPYIGGTKGTPETAYST